jgi:hypothetical protein
MVEVNRDCPAIHVCLSGEVNPEWYRWVEVGAEEEGVPTRQVDVTNGDAVAAAYQAAESSRFYIGVCLTPNQVVLHEMHMPLAQPVLTFDIGNNAPKICRLMGGNAARMVVRLPLRFGDDPVEPEPPARRSHKPYRQPAPIAASPAGTPANLSAIARAIAGKNNTSAVKAPPPASQPGDLPISDIRLIAKIVARILRERGIQ